MTDIATPFGTVSAAPSSLDGETIAIWLIGALVALLIAGGLKLWAVVESRAAACRAENEVARAEAKAAREQNERLYQQAIEATAARERALAEVVERNTSAWNTHAETIRTHFGSDYYRAIRDQRDRGDHHPHPR